MANDDRGASIFNAATGELLGSYGKYVRINEERANSVLRKLGLSSFHSPEIAVSADGSMLATGQDPLNIWSL